MTKILIALAAMAATAAPLVAIESTKSPSAERPVMVVGADRPILLKRMVVTATALPERAGAQSIQ